MRSGGALGALRAVWSNEAMRRAQLALAGSTIGDWSYGVAINVLVYQRSGAAWVGIAQICRLVPAAIAAPLLASLVDRHSKQRVLFATDAVRAVLMTAACLAAALHAPMLALLGLIGVTAVVSTLFRPAQAAMLPTLVREPEELTVANVTAATVESTGCVVGPALGAAALALFGVALSFVVPIVAYLFSAFAVTRVRPYAPEAMRADDELESEEAPARDRRVLAGLWAILRNAKVRLLVGLYCAQTFVAGALNVLTVVVAFELLGSGRSGVGALTAASGIGSLIGAVPALALAARARLTTIFMSGLVLWGLPIALIPLAPNLPSHWRCSLSSASATRSSTSRRSRSCNARRPASCSVGSSACSRASHCSGRIGVAVTPVLLRLAGTRAPRRDRCGPAGGGTPAVATLAHPDGRRSTRAASSCCAAIRSSPRFPRAPRAARGLPEPLRLAAGRWCSTKATQAIATT